MPDAPRQYARLSYRLQASILDFALYIYTAYAAVLFATWLPEGYGGGPLALAVLVVMVLLEPVMVARHGTTPGHWLFGLRIVSEDTGRPPSLPMSLARYVTKLACLGPWLSPVIAVTRTHQGLHDTLAGTVVDVIRPDSWRGRMRAYDPASDAVTVGAGPRVLSTVGYSIALFGAFVILLLLTSDTCMSENRCGPVERVTYFYGERLWFVLQYAILWLGPAGRLPGVRQPVPVA